MSLSFDDRPAASLCAAHPWGIAQTRHRYRPNERGQIHGAQAQAAFSNLEDLPGESRKTVVSIDFFTVPTIRFQVQYVFLVLAHDRRRIVHFNVTSHPTAEWTAQQQR